MSTEKDTRSGSGIEQAKTEIEELIDSIDPDEYGGFEDGKRDGLREALLIVSKATGNNQNRTEGDE